MKISSDEITSVIKKQIENYKVDLNVDEVGTVLEVGDGIAHIYGLENCMAGELLELPHGVYGMALNLEESNVGAVLLGQAETIKEGDTVKIDYEGFKDGVAFEGGKAENYGLKLGSGSFIPGFEDQLIGCKAGDEKELNLTFPEDYHAEDLKGAAVVFKVKVH